MSRRQRILLVVAVAIALLFVASVTNQRRTGDGDPESGPGGLVGWLGDRVGAAAGADPADLTASCEEPDGRLVFGGSCTIEVAEGGSALRLVRLLAQHSVTVTADAPAGDFTISADLEPGDRTQVAIGSDGGEIELRCHDSDDCVVTIGGDDG
jgi:hypothetical protein